MGTGIDSLNLMIVGVGGQGTLLASRVIGRAATAAGYDVKLSEVHGMSQRGGSVVTYVRLSREAVRSPLIDEGRADIILAFESLEAYRGVPFLKTGGKLLSSTQKINPMPVIVGAAEYPSDIAGKIREKGIELSEIDALGLAAQAGSQRAVNIVMIGLLAKTTDLFTKEQWVAAIKESVPEKLAAVNLRAFELGNK